MQWSAEMVRALHVAAAPPTQPRTRTNLPAYDPSLFDVPPPVKVPPHILRPSYADHPQGIPAPLPDGCYGECKDPEAITKMRRACQLAGKALKVACETAREGVTTDEVDRTVSNFVISQGAYPVGINYYGFPRGLCSSVNEVALHGVPNTRPLESGDIVNFDVTVYLDGFYGDTSAMVSIGEVDDDARRLVDTTKWCLYGAISLVRPGLPLKAIGEFCSQFARKHGFGIVSEYCGHFIGKELHMKPNVLHVRNGVNLELQPGMTFTIEPILVEGGAEIHSPEEDGWTILTKNRGWAAQWEHTVLVTKDGVEVLTMVAD